VVYCVTHGKRSHKKNMVKWIRIQAALLAVLSGYLSPFSTLLLAVFRPSFRRRIFFPVIIDPNLLHFFSSSFSPSSSTQLAILSTEMTRFRTITQSSSSLSAAGLSVPLAVCSCQ
jgi:hypothetical protein